MMKFIKEILLPKLVSLVSDNFKIYFIVLFIIATYSFRISEFIKYNAMYYVDAPIVNVHKNGKIEVRIGNKIEKFRLFGLDFPNFFDKCESDFNNLYEKFIKKELRTDDLIDIKIIKKNFLFSDYVIIFKNNININDLIIKKFDMKRGEVDFCNKISYTNLSQ